MELSNRPANQAIIGYVGNLRDRIDSELLIKIADNFHDGHLLLVGPTGGNVDIERLRFHPNITMAGVRSYSESRKIAAGFDIGIIPHTLNSLTDSMNPLKFFLYKELGIPVVTTPIRNISVKQDSVFQSDGTHEDFIRLLSFALKSRTKARAFGSLKSQEDLWSTRVNNMLKSWKS